MRIRSSGEARTTESLNRVDRRQASRFRSRLHSRMDESQPIQRDAVPEIRRLSVVVDPCADIAVVLVGAVLMYT